MSAKRIGFLSLVAAYVVAGFLTFGYGANRLCQFNLDALSVEDGCNKADDAAAYLAIIWPVYWAARGAIEITKP